MSKLKPLLIASGLSLVLLSGCSGGGSEATPTETATPEMSASPEAALPAELASPDRPDPRVSPLGKKPASEEEKEYYRLHKKAEDLVLARDYENAIPLFEEALEERPDDVKNSFYLLLAHGSLEPVPSKGSAAYPYAKRVVELAPDSNEANRAKAYLIASEFSPGDDFKYGDKTFFSYGNYFFDTGVPYKLSTPAHLHTEYNPRLSSSAKATLWETEIAPDLASDTVLLDAGTEVEILTETHFFHSLTSWRKPLPPEPKNLDTSIFEVHAFYVEVVSEGDNKAKKGWLVNQIDRFIDKPGEDQYGVWIPNRLNLEREISPEG